MSQSRYGEAGNKIPTAALVYGIVGILPYFGAAFVVWLQDSDLSPRGLSFIYGYSLVILTFLSAIHWGRALAGDFPNALGFFQLGWSVLPAVLCPTALVQPYKPGIPIFLAIIFAYAFFMDIRAVRLGFFPPWFGRLRKYLTIGVLVVLFFTFLEITQFVPVG